jgi:uncharacterized protein (DUF1330 family)
MPAYIIVDVDVQNEEGYEEYKKLTPATIAAYNGKFIVRGGRVDQIEGEWEPGRIVVLEFPSRERALEWWSSAEYEKAKPIRHRNASTNMILVDGI